MMLMGKLDTLSALLEHADRTRDAEGYHALFEKRRVVIKALEAVEEVSAEV